MIDQEAQTIIKEYVDQGIICDIEAGISDYQSVSSSDEILSTERMNELPME